MNYIACSVYPGVNAETVPSCLEEMFRHAHEQKNRECLERHVDHQHCGIFFLGEIITSFLVEQSFIFRHLSH